MKKMWERLLRFICNCICKHRPKILFQTGFTFNKLKIKGVKIMLQGFVGQSAESTEDIVVYYIDGSGNEVISQLEPGTIGFSSSNPEILEVTEDINNEKRFSMRILAPGNAGVICTGDADLGQGIVEISGVVVDVQGRLRLATNFKSAVVSAFHD